MSKDLEALERAKMEHSIIKQGFPEQEYIALLTKIEKSLEVLEIIKKHTMYLKNENTFVFVNLTTDIKEKLKEALL